MARLESGKVVCDWAGCRQEMDYKDIYADKLQPNPHGNLCIDCRLKMEVVFTVVHDEAEKHDIIKERKGK